MRNKNELSRGVHARDHKIFGQPEISLLKIFFYIYLQLNWRTEKTDVRVSILYLYIFLYFNIRSGKAYISIILIQVFSVSKAIIFIPLC